MAAISNMAPIKNFQLTYEAPNAANAFSEGDVITGTVTFTLTQQTKVKSLQVKVKAGAKVWWNEGSGFDDFSYSNHKEFFEVKEYFMAENPKGRPTQSVAVVICFALLHLGRMTLLSLFLVSLSAFLSDLNLAKQISRL